MKTLLTNLKIFDGTCVIAEKGHLLFDESGILQVLTGDEPLPQADAVLDCTGKTVTPGLMDGHVHLGSTEMVRPQTPQDYAVSGALTAAQAGDFWQWGITTVRNCGVGTNADIYVRNLIRDGKISGVRIIACGKGISITGGHGWPMSHECDTPDEVRKAARLQLREGADMVKLLATGGMGTKGSIPNAPQLTEAQMRAAVEEAEAVGAITAAHCTGLEGAHRAIRAGVRCIEHAQLDEETTEMMAEAGAWYCPTIVTRYNILHTTDPNYQWMRAKANPADLDRKRRALQLCKKHGIPIIAGTDAGPNPLTKLGSSLWTELGIYQAYGLSPQEVLHTATVSAAKMMRIDHLTGSIRPGLAADLALFCGDPTQDVTQVNTVCMTWQNGVLRWKQ